MDALQTHECALMCDTYLGRLLLRQHNGQEQQAPGSDEVEQSLRHRVLGETVNIYKKAAMKLNRASDTGCLGKLQTKTQKDRIRDAPAREHDRKEPCHRQGTG